MSSLDTILLLQIDRMTYCEATCDLTPGKALHMVDLASQGSVRSRLLGPGAPKIGGLVVKINNYRSTNIPESNPQTVFYMSINIIAILG